MSRTRKDKFVGFLLCCALVAGISLWAYAFVSSAVSDRLAKCQGEFDTAQCHIDREARNAKIYAREKARQ